MIRELPETQMGQTHIRLWRLEEQRGGWARIRAYLGTLDDTGEFVRAEGLREVEATFVSESYAGVIERAHQAGAPEGEKRLADYWRYYLDHPDKVDIQWRR